MTRPKDHLIAAAVSEIARLGAECGTHQSFRQQVSQIVVPLVDGLAQMEREAMEAAPVAVWMAPDESAFPHEEGAHGRGTACTVPLVRQAYHEAQDGLLNQAQDEVARLRAELAEVQRPLDAQMVRLNENLTAANARIAELEEKLNEVHSWIVCAAIASPDDMMQNAERIEEITRPRQ